MTTQAQQDATRRYYQKNKDKIKKYRKEYQQKNKDRRNARARAKTAALRDLERWNQENHETTTYQQWKNRQQ